MKPPQNVAFLDRALRALQETVRESQEATLAAHIGGRTGVAEFIRCTCVTANRSFLG